MRAVIPLLGLLAAFAGCDSLFKIDGRVTRCSDGHPLVGVKAQLFLVAGISDREDVTSYSDPDGSYEAVLNEPPSVAARLVLDKPQFITVEQSYQAAPSQAQDFCLMPNP